MKINYGQMNLDIHKEQHIADEMVVLQSAFSDMLQSRKRTVSAKGTGANEVRSTSETDCSPFYS